MKKAITAVLLAAALCLSLAACGNPADNQPKDQEAAPPQQSAGESLPAGPAEQTLASLLGDGYEDYLAETITMQMGARMEKDPEIVFFPIRDDAPLSDYVTIDENTPFTLDEGGNPVICFAAGTVAEEVHGEQSFRIPKR